MAFQRCRYYSSLFHRCLGKSSFAYTTKRFHVSYGKASYVNTLNAAANLISLFILLPAVIYLFDKKLRWVIAVRDKRIAQISALMMSLRCFIIFIAPNLLFLIIGIVIFGLGSSFTVTARTLVTSLVDAEHISTVYATISTISSLGMLVAGPLLAFTFHMGMALGDLWVGMPFLFAAVLYALTVFGVSSVKLSI
ncbi:hypothetical protein N7495_000874 [Penicillium taxi]|uniref:uncharacterized protein n=1 Tax=Penicillium taxi TaxID=168475 RepID=UPI002545B0FB|nr:uncharacterized protein N7495_000874 [Penicillium taxi]KAJ5908192.1 hypothetical protein N7495_000874 [Penicillium taxi]